MKVKKMLAVLSAITIMGSYSMSCINPCLFRTAAEETISDAESETCGVEISLSAASDPMPEDVHIKAHLVKTVGDQATEIEEWEVSQDSVKVINGLEYGEDIKYTILIDEQPEEYSLPLVTDVILPNKGYVDKIALCGAGYAKTFASKLGVDDIGAVDFDLRYLKYNTNSTQISGASYKMLSEAYIIDDNGVRYSSSGVILLPDGHYKAVVKPADGYRFVKPNSESALIICDMQTFKNDYDLSYFDQDFENGIEFNVEGGKTDSLLNFFLEKVPSENDSCSADISVVDSETGEPLKGFKFNIIYNEGPFRNDGIRWDSSDANPIKIDKLGQFEYDYTVKPVYIPENYTIPETNTTFKLDEYGEHKDIVIKAERISAEKEAAISQKVVLPAEDPVPIDDKHCAVTLGAISSGNGAAIPGATAKLFKKNADGEKTVILEWDAEKEPVKTINDLEYDENAEYSFDVDAKDLDGFSDIKLDLDKAGSTDKVVQCMYPDYMRHVDCKMKSGSTFPNGGYAIDGDGFKELVITDNKGYRYAYNYHSVIVLPDGEYNVNPLITEGYRPVPYISEMAGIFINRYKTEENNVINNAENCKNGITFTVKDGECDKSMHFFAEKIPTAETANTATVTVVDEVTGEPVKGVKLAFSSYSNNGSIKWNTTDAPEVTFDDLTFINKNYTITLRSIPDGYSCKDKDVQFSFGEYGNNENVVIKLSRESLKGDANCDKKVDISDAVFIMQSLSNPSKYQFTDEGKANADCSGNGDGVTNGDALAIQKYMLKLIDKLG